MCLACVASTGPREVHPAPFPDAALPLPWPDGERAGGTLRWTGVAGILLELDGVRIAFDPFVSRPGPLAVLLRRPRIDAAAVAAHFAELDAVFVGPTHYDHVMDVPEAMRVSPRATVHGSPTTVELLRRLGVDEARLRASRDGTVVEVGPFRVTAVASEHGVVPVVRHVDRIELPRKGLPWTPLRYPRGPVLAWRVQAGGRTFHVQGSAGIDEAALASQPPADVVIACLAARHGTERYLERLGAVLRPRILMPCHHDHLMRPLAEPPRPVPGLDWPGFLADADDLATRWGTRLALPPFNRSIDW